MIFLKIFHLIMGSPVTSVGYWHSDKYWFCVLFFLVQILSYSWFQSAHVNHWVPSGGKGTHTVWSRLSWFTFICSQSYTIVFSESESCSVVTDSATPWTVAHQVPLSTEFSRPEYWSGLPFPSPGNLPDPGIKTRSPVLQADSLQSEPPGKPIAFPRMMIILWQFNRGWSQRVF